MQWRTIRFVLIFFFCVWPLEAMGDPIAYSGRHEYRLTLLDDKASARLICFEQTRRILLNEVGGRLAGYADIRVLNLDRRDLAAMISPLAEVVVTGEEWSDKMVRLQASIRIEPVDTLQFLNGLALTSGKGQELRDIGRRTDLALAELDRIGKGWKGPGRSKTDLEDQKIKEGYRRGVAELVLSDHLLRGWRFSWWDRHEEAAEEFSRALSQIPDQPELYRRRGVAYLKMEEPDKALADFNRAIDLDPKYARAYANRGYLFLETGDPGKALLDFNRALELKKPYENPDPAEDLSAYTVALKLKEAESKAKEAASKSKPAAPGTKPHPKGDLKPDPKTDLKADPKAAKPAPPATKLSGIEGYRQLALQRLGPPKPDMDYYAAILDKNPGYAPAWYGRGLANQTAGRHQAALADFNEAIRLMPENPFYYHARATSNSALKRFKEAIEDYGRAIALNARFAQSYYERGLLRFQAGEYRGAVADFSRTAELNPKHPDATKMRDAANAKVGRKPDLAYLDGVIADNPLQPYAYTQRAIAQWLEGRHQKSIEDCTAVIRLKPDDARAYLIRGIQYGNLGEYRKALSDHDRALSLAPGDLLVFGSRVKVFGGDAVLYEKALSEYRKIVSRTYDQAEPAVYRGLSNAFLGNYEDAIKDCRKAIRLDPDFSEAYLWHGIIHHILGAYELALGYYGKALERAPQDPLSLYLQGMALSGLGQTAQAVASLKEADRLGVIAAREKLKQLGLYSSAGPSQGPSQDQKRTGSRP